MAATEFATMEVWSQHRAYQTFDQKDLYPEPIDKATAIFESLIANHPFIDGNKRIAYVVLRLTLQQYGLDIVASEDQKYDFNSPPTESCWLRLCK